MIVLLVWGTGNVSNFYFLKVAFPFLSRDIYIGIHRVAMLVVLQIRISHYMLCKLITFEQRNNSGMKISIFFFNSSATYHDIFFHLLVLFL